jgi:hypothetical protein
MEEWLQVLRDELQRYDDEDLRYWPVLWWKELHREGMNPLQAIRYTKQAISGVNGQAKRDQVRPCKRGPLG